MNGESRIEHVMRYKVYISDIICDDCSKFSRVYSLRLSTILHLK